MYYYRRQSLLFHYNRDGFVVTHDISHCVFGLGDWNRRQRVEKMREYVFRDCCTISCNLYEMLVGKRSTFSSRKQQLVSDTQLWKIDIFRIQIEIIWENNIEWTEENRILLYVIKRDFFLWNKKSVYYNSYPNSSCTSNDNNNKLFKMCHWQLTLVN